MDLPASLLQSLRALNPFLGTRTASSFTCFPARFCQSGNMPTSQVCQDLLTVGTRLWGFGAAQNLLRVKIYEFAVYMDKQQVLQRLVLYPSHKHCQAARGASFSCA